LILLEKSSSCASFVLQCPQAPRLLEILATRIAGVRVAVEVEIEVPQFKRLCSAAAEHVGGVSNSMICTHAQVFKKSSSRCQGIPRISAAGLLPMNVEPFNPTIFALQIFNPG